MDIITIGDGMITFDPVAKGPLRFVQQFERKIGGAELNVILGCARLGAHVGWIGRLGKDEFGRHIFNTVRGEGVDVSEVKMIEDYATSLNFKEVQESGESKTFYYRKPSPTDHLTRDTLPKEYIAQAKVLHISGVYPAISENNRHVVKEAVQLAKAQGVKVSLDLNLRLKLWSIEEARDTLLHLLPNVDYLLAGREELALLFNTEDPATWVRELSNHAIEIVIMKDGENGSYLLTNDTWKHFSAVPACKVVDTVGAGDGFAAGFLVGVVKEWSLDECIQFANTVGAMVVQVAGDNEGLPYMEDVEAFLGKRQVIER